METYWVLMGVVQAVSLLVLGFNLYEYRRVLRKRRVMWASVSQSAPVAKASIVPLALYVIFTFAMIGIALLLYLRVS